MKQQKLSETQQKCRVETAEDGGGIVSCTLVAGGAEVDPQLSSRTQPQAQLVDADCTATVDNAPATGDATVSCKVEANTGTAIQECKVGEQVVPNGASRVC